MNTHVIILAQGTQQRLGDATGGIAKQLLPLPACGNAPILVRTLHQLDKIMEPDDVTTVVGWHEIFVALWEGWKTSKQPSRRAGSFFEPVSLPDPGNSSLKGIHRYLESQALIAGATKPDRTIVLLGDVVYSWACLEAIFADLSDYAAPGRFGVAARFVGTSDISPNGGELWGVAWMRDSHEVMVAALHNALKKHPPYQDTYQPGQLRRWMWALHPSYQTTSRYTAVDDYTRDVDLPEHLPLLGATSELACADDREHGMVW